METRLHRRLPQWALLIGLLSTAGLAARQLPRDSEMSAGPSSRSISGSVTALRSADPPMPGLNEAMHTTSARWSTRWTPSTMSIGTPAGDDRPVFGEPIETPSLARGPRPQLNLKTLEFRIPLAGDLGFELQPTTTPTDDETEVPATAAAAASDTETSQGERPAQVSSTEVVLRFLASGAGLAAAVLILFGGYALLRPRVRAYLGRLRMRGLDRTRRERRRRDRNR